MYKIDLALSVKGVYDKIALEISGDIYQSEEGRLSGKKKLKM